MTLGKKMARRDYSWLYFAGYSLVLVIAILGLFYPQSTGVGSAAQIDVTLALEDNTNQSLLATNTWTSIRYSRNIHVSSAWNHTAGSDEIICLRAGTYLLYFSIQPRLNSSQTQTNFFCKACHLYEEIRATIQYDGVGAIQEIRSSFTEGDREARFISKSLLFYANPTDVIRLQFRSLCPNIIIAPPPILNALPTSATLAISNA